MARQHPANLIAIGLAVGRALEIEQPGVPGGELHTLVAVPGGPARDLIEAVERRGVAQELRQIDGRTLDRLHSLLSLPSRSFSDALAIRRDPVRRTPRHWTCVCRP